MIENEPPPRRPATERPTPKRRRHRPRPADYNVFLVIRDGEPRWWWLSPDIALLDGSGAIVPWLKPVRSIAPGAYTVRATVSNLGHMHATQVAITLYRRYLHVEPGFTQLGVDFATIEGGASATVDFPVAVAVPDDRTSVKCQLLVNCWHYLDPFAPGDAHRSFDDRHVAERRILIA